MLWQKITNEKVVEWRFLDQKGRRKEKGKVTSGRGLFFLIDRVSQLNDVTEKPATNVPILSVVHLNRVDQYRCVQCSVNHECSCIVLAESKH
jgi:hypothetical protein